MFRSWLRWYLLLIAFLIAAALVKRQIEHKQLACKLTAQLLPMAADGSDDSKLMERYFWGGSSQLPNGNWWSGGSMQGPAIYLLKHGYMDDKLARVMLLAEARRLNDWQYTYPAVYNYDLRKYLSERCLHAYPDDLAVAWASGALSLAAGDDEDAVKQLARIIGKPEQWDGCVKLCDQLGVKPEHMLGRYCAALTLTGDDQRAQDLAAALRRNPQLAGFFANWDRDRAIGNTKEPPPVLALRATDSLLVTDSDYWNPESMISPIARRLANRYAYDPDEKWLRPIESMIQRIKDTTDHKTPRPLRLDNYLLAENETNLELEHLRAYAAAMQWDKAATYAAELQARYAGESSTLIYADRYQAAMLLLRVANRQALDQSLDFARKSDSQEDERYYFWPAADGQYPGPFGQLRDRDLLVLLMRSPQFASALTHAGTSVQAVVSQQQAACRPGRDYYYDSANGDLGQLWKRLHLSPTTGKRIPEA